MVENQKVVAIIQARITSSRLPGKVLKDLYGKTLLERVINQIEESNYVDEIWVATSSHYTDDLVEILVNKLNHRLYRGSLEDVLSRFANISKKTNADVIVRITADNPFTSSEFMDLGIKKVIDENLDYVSFDNIPYGSGSEIIRSKSLLECFVNAKTPSEKEHVTKYIKDNPKLFSTALLYPAKQLYRSDISVTIDTLEDYIRIYKLVSRLEKAGESLNLNNAIRFIDDK